MLIARGLKDTSARKCLNAIVAMQKMDGFENPCPTLPTGGNFAEDPQRQGAWVVGRGMQGSELRAVARLNQYQGGMCISGSLTMTERTPRHLISPLGPSWVGTDSAV